MKNILFLIVLLAAGYQAWLRFALTPTVEPLQARSYIAVYGRDSCGWTQRALRELESTRANYQYFIVDEKSVADLLHSRMQASGISTARYDLPVIDVNGQLMVRPDLDVVLGRYKDKLYEQAGYR